MRQRHSGRTLMVRRLPGRSRMLFTAFLLLLPTACMHAQDTIIANPNAAKLHVVWAVEGINENDQVGASAGGLGDIFSDGKAAFAVGRLQPFKLEVYHADSSGAVRTMHTFDSCSI